MHRYLILTGIISSLLLSSCNSYKKLTYLQNIGKEYPDSLYAKKKLPYRLQPGDILYVRIITQNEVTDRLFNPNLGIQGTAQYMRTENLYIMGYEINDSGYIELPVIKEVFVQGLTVDETKEKILVKARKFIKEPQIIIKPHTFKFTILGEIASPGVKEHGAYQVNLMEALALGGDITYYGNRENILVLRATKDGSKAFRVDVTDNELVASEAYYIQPNDIIYVEPLKTTLFRVRTADYLFYLTAFTSVLTTFVLILNLFK